MPAHDMPAAEVDVDEALVRALLVDQHPDLARLPLELVANGWDNAIFRLGDELLVRLPRRQLAAVLVEHEQRWLPALAPRLPLPIPAPVRVGRPALGYPWSWSVCPWLPGDIALRTPPEDVDAAAVVLGGFVAAMHVAAPDDAPPNPVRGVPLAARDDLTRQRLEQLHDVIDADRVAGSWRDALSVPPWAGSPLWLHGDLHPGNVLVDHGRLSAVIDFGDITAGDPATDMIAAWMLFPPEQRPAFRHAAGVDDDTWFRGRGWALTFAVGVLANSADNPLYEALGRRTVAAVLQDSG